MNYMNDLALRLAEDEYDFDFSPKQSIEFTTVNGHICFYDNSNEILFEVCIMECYDNWEENCFEIINHETNEHYQNLSEFEAYELIEDLIDTYEIEEDYYC